MKKQNNGCDITRQSDETVTRLQKHDVNLQKNSTLYFQIGLILCLLMTFGLLEMRFETKMQQVNPPIVDEDPYDYNYAENFTIEPDKKQEKQIEKKIINTPVFKEVPDDLEIKEATNAVIDPEPPSNPGVPNFNGLEKKPEETNFPIFVVQKVPVYPGCEKESTNVGRRQCMSEKIQKIVTRNFNRDLASDLNLSGRQRINVMFRIDKTGHVTKIEARAPHNILEKEAVRVIELLPEMTPGKMQDKNVGVFYSLPIVFDVQN